MFKTCFEGGKSLYLCLKVIKYWLSVLCAVLITTLYSKCEGQIHLGNAELLFQTLVVAYFQLVRVC